MIPVKCGAVSPRRGLVMDERVNGSFIGGWRKFFGLDGIKTGRFGEKVKKKFAYVVKKL